MVSPEGDGTTFRAVLTGAFVGVGGCALLLKVGPLNGMCFEPSEGFFWTAFVGLRTPCVGLRGLLGDFTTLRPFLIGAFFSGGLLTPCEGLGDPCLMTLLLMGVAMVGGATTLMAELKGASLAVKGIVGCRALLKVFPPDGLLGTGGGLGATGRVLSTGSLPINLRKERSCVADV